MAQTDGAVAWKRKRVYLLKMKGQNLFIFRHPGRRRTREQADDGRVSYRCALPASTAAQPKRQEITGGEHTVIKEASWSTGACDASREPAAAR